MKTDVVKYSWALILSTSMLFGATNDEKVEAFLKSTISPNSEFTVNSISIKDSVKLDNVPNWKAYFVNINLHLKKENRDVNMKDIIFSDGNVMSKDLVSLNTRASLKSEVSLPINPKLYDKEHLIAGDKNAINRLIVFSDPVCPYCIDYLPDLIKAAQKYPKTFALYYYHLPLASIHKSAPGFTKAMIVAQKQGVKDVALKTYESQYSYKIPTEEEIAKQFNKTFGTHITPKQMNEAWVLEKIKNDTNIAKEMNVNGTPTVYVNGKNDTSRRLFQNLLTKAKK